MLTDITNQILHTSTTQGKEHGKRLWRSSSYSKNKVVKTEDVIKKDLLQRHVFRNDFQMETLKPKKIPSKPKCIFNHSDTYINLWGDYADDVYTYLCELEKLHRPRKNYMSKQSEITEKMRYVLVDWMVEVCTEMKYSLETLHLSVSIIDRFLTRIRISRHTLQCLGVTALLIATKYEEQNPMSISNTITLTANSYSKAQVVAMEKKVLKVLNYHIGTVTLYEFCNRFGAIANLDEQETYFSFFLADISLLFYHLLQYHPSQLAAAAVSITLHTCRKGSHWSKELLEYTGYDLIDIQQCICDLHRSFLEAKQKQPNGIFSKYASSDRLQVALLGAKSCPPPMVWNLFP